MTKNENYLYENYKHLIICLSFVFTITERIDDMENRVPIWKKVTLTVEEAAKYSNIGINKISALLNQPDCPFVLYVGEHKRLVKREKFERYIEKSYEI